MYNRNRKNRSSFEGTIFLMYSVKYKCNMILILSKKKLLFEYSPGRNSPKLSTVVLGNDPTGIQKEKQKKKD